jgi:hypothetical protein
MPRYYIHIYDDLVMIDEDGMELPDLAAARHQAVRGARSIMADHLRAGRPLKLFHRIEIADHRSKVLAVIPFRALVTIQDQDDGC